MAQFVRTLFYFVVFLLLFILRWVGMESPLPASWTPDSKVRFTANVIDKPEQTDTQTIIRQRIWYIPLRGYAAIIPGSRVAFTGTVEPRAQLGKIVKLVLVDPTFEIIDTPQENRLRLIENIIIILSNWREKWVSLLEKVLPEPMASLAAGILLGLKAQMPDNFYQNLVVTGTLHIIAASGYNVSIVLSVILSLMLRVVSRGWASVFGMVGLVAYILIAGASASVVRAGIMGSLTLVAYYVGRPTEARRLLWLSAALMLLFSPLLLFDIGFQLSVSATAGILYLEPFLRKNIEQRILNIEWMRGKVQAYLAAYLYPTLAATIATLPVILWQFGRVSWISPLVNMLVLPLVPLIMGLTALVIGVGMVVPVLGEITAWILYPVLWWMVAVIQLFG